MTDWSGLLKWSLQYSDGTQDMQHRVLSEDDKAFLKGAMEEMVLDVGKSMKSYIATLKDETEEDEILKVLEEVNDLVDQIDNAYDFVLLGGLNVLLPLLADSRPRVRAEACGLLATATHNHPRVQIRVFEANALYGMMQLMLDDNERVRAKATSAVSALVQHCAPAEASFHELSGAQSLATVLEQDESRARAKAIFLIPQVLSISGFAESLAHTSAVTTVLSLLDTEPREGSGIRDHLINCVAALGKVEPTRLALLAGGAEAKLPQLLQRLQTTKQALNDEHDIATIDQDIAVLESAIPNLALPQASGSQVLMLGGGSA